MKTVDSLGRFRKVCGLLASDHAGERAAAALKATQALKAMGKTWANVGFGNVATLAQDYANAATVELYQTMLNAERARTTDMAEEIGRLKREVARLKGMWPKGPPARAA